MKSDLKKLIGIFIAIAVFTSAFGLNTSAKEITVLLNGEALECPVPPKIQNGSTMVPMRAIFEALGMNVEWNNDTKTVTAQKKDKTVTLTVGENVLYLNEDEVELSVAPYIESDTTMVPVRAVSESVDAKVKWNSFMHRVEIVTDDFTVDDEQWKSNVGTINLTDFSVTGEGVYSEGNVVYITDGGDFEVTGENADAMIYVNALERVKLRLNGVKLTNLTGPAIFFDNTDKAFITVSKGSENYIADGEEYSVDAKAAIFANDDLEIKGEGILNITSKAHHGIASDDDIKIEEGTLVINAEKKDGIHANNTIKIQGGNITVTAYGDGIQAEEDVVIQGGEINVTTTGVVVQTRSDFGNFGGMMPQGNFGGRGGRVRPENMPQGGTMPPEMEGMPQGGMMPPEESLGEETEDENVATKGIKAETDITISGGKIVVNSSDHAIHSAMTLNITGGELILSSKAGKGISAHGDVVIDDGIINITKATEGLESKANLTINGGKITIIGSDDGINAGGTGGRDVASRQNVNAETGHDLTINGGEIFVNAQGDGLDSNGRMIINGGNVIVEGPTNNGNGALDSGGVILINGGTLIALGASGMAETPGNESLQPSFRLVTDTNIPQNSEIVIKDSEGNIIYSYTTQKTGNSIVFSSDKLVKDSTYTIKIGETEHYVTLTGTVTNSGNGNFGSFGGRGGRGW